MIRPKNSNFGAGPNSCKLAAPRCLTLYLFVALMTLMTAPQRDAIAQEKLPQQFDALAVIVLDPESKGESRAEAENGIVELWRQHPFNALFVIDSYLEGSLKLVEGGTSADDSQVKVMHQKAIVGAQGADQAFATEIFADYAASFVGWTSQQQKQFRGGQKAFGEARAAMKADDAEKALAAGKACLDAAMPLGDWWGSAMGYGIMGAAHQQLGHIDEAITAYSSARLINHQLRLGGSELRCLEPLASLLLEGKRLPRAQVICDRGVVLSKQLGDSKRQLWFLEQGAKTADAAGDPESAKQLRKQAKALGEEGS